VYRLLDLLLAARRKHGSVAGMAAANQACVQAAAARKQGKQAAAQGRQEQLKEALAPLGVTLR